MALTKFSFLYRNSTLQGLTLGGASDSHFISAPLWMVWIEYVLYGVNCNGMFYYGMLQNSISEYKYYYRRQMQMHGCGVIIKIPVESMVLK
jgi:hypothetical protein